MPACELDTSLCNIERNRRYCTSLGSLAVSSVSQDGFSCPKLFTVNCIFLKNKTKYIKTVFSFLKDIKWK
jgi:hypothetical protein